MAGPDPRTREDLLVAARGTPPVSSMSTRVIATSLAVVFAFDVVATVLGRATYGNVAHGTGALLGWVAATLYTGRSGGRLFRSSK